MSNSDVSNEEFFILVSAILGKDRDRVQGAIVIAIYDCETCPTPHEKFISRSSYDDAEATYILRACIQKMARNHDTPEGYT